MRIAYADPPYLGCCGLYDHEHHGGGCWDDLDTHWKLIEQLSSYDGWVLHLSVPSLGSILPLCPPCRVMSWVKPFAAFKRNVSVAYAWEPVIVKAARKPVVTHRVVMRDFIEEIEAPAVRESITLKRGLTGAKPEKVCMWAFEMVGLERDDEFVDLFPGSGAVTRAHEKWMQQFDLSGGVAVSGEDVTGNPLDYETLKRKYVTWEWSKEGPPFPYPREVMGDVAALLVECETRQREVEELRAKNRDLALENLALAAKVRGLRDAIEDIDAHSSRLAEALRSVVGMCHRHGLEYPAEMQHARTLLVEHDDRRRALGGGSV